MNDYWNDPPENPEPPECCGDIMDVTADGVCVCPKCGKRIEPKCDVDVKPTELEEMPIEQPPHNNKCAHGIIGQCNTCDIASDIAFDSARERRFFK